MCLFQAENSHMPPTLELDKRSQEPDPVINGFHMP